MSACYQRVGKFSHTYAGLCDILGKYALALLLECQYCYVWEQEKSVYESEYELILSKHLTLPYLLRQSNGLILAPGIMANNCSSTAA